MAKETKVIHVHLIFKKKQAVFLVLYQQSILNLLLKK